MSSARSSANDPKELPDKYTERLLERIYPPEARGEDAAYNLLVGRLKQRNRAQSEYLAWMRAHEEKAKAKPPEPATEPVAEKEMEAHES